MRKFPFYRQLDAMDCGPTCLRMIAKHYGKHYSLETLRQKCFIGREGVSMLGISTAAEGIGFRTVGVHILFQQLCEAPLPCIVHWKQNHFVVVYKIDVKQKFTSVGMQNFTSVETQNFASLQLGDIQSAFSTFVKAREDYLHFVFADYHNRKINVIRKQMATQRRLLQKSKQQLSISSQQLDIARQLLAMDSFLLAKRSLSLADYQNSKNSYFAQAQAFESSKMGIDNQEMSILQSEQAIFDLEQARIEEEKSLTVTLNTAKEQLMAQIRSWEQNYLLIAPCSGKTTFTKYWQKNQNVTAGEVLVTIVPACDKHIIGKILLPPKGAGKVRAGQTVNVKLDNYPYLEYGMMKVKINNISLVPIQVGENEKAYMLEVEFPEKLVTTYGKELTFSQEMSGTAEIITDDLRLLDKFLNPIRDVIRR